MKYDDKDKVGKKLTWAKPKVTTVSTRLAKSKSTARVPNEQNWDSWWIANSGPS